MLQVREDTVMNMQTRTSAITVALFGAAMLGSVLPSGAAPISPSTALPTQAAASSEMTEVYYRRHYRGGRVYRRAPGAAIGLGILGAAAGVAAYGAYGPSYYGPGYSPGYYGGGPYPYRRQYYAPY
nr:hypothetical protein HAV00_27995 [Bradyrhizobium symbiodeficiens]